MKYKFPERIIRPRECSIDTLACYMKPSERRRQGRFDCCIFVYLNNAQMAEVESNVTASCLWFPSQSVTSWCLKNVPPFILSYQAHAAQRRGLIPSEMALDPGEVCFSQMAGSCFLLVGCRKDINFTLGARFRKSINLWLTAANKDVSHTSWCTMEEISHI